MVKTESDITNITNQSTKNPTHLSGVEQQTLSRVHIPRQEDTPDDLEVTLGDFKLLQVFLFEACR